MSSVNRINGHARTSPPSVRKVAPKTARSAPSSKPAGGSKATFKPLRVKQSKDKGEEEASIGDDEDMTTSFLQFCAMCEKQIVVPNDSILYCSENCRRKDALGIPAQHPYLALINQTFTTSEDPDDQDDPESLKNHTILPRHLPTPRPFPFARIPPQAHNGKSDLDPSEWKPAERKPTLTDRSGSDAFQYLSQFHRSTSSLPVSSRRPRATTHFTTASVTTGTTPSLSYTPTISTSSEQSLTGTPFEFVHRPLLPRIDPAFSAPTTTKSVDLVIPHVVASTFSVPARHPVEAVTNHRLAGISGAKKSDDAVAGATLGDLSYEKKSILGSTGAAAGSLKKLLAVGRM